MAGASAPSRHLGGLSVIERSGKTPSMAFVAPASSCPQVFPCPTRMLAPRAVANGIVARNIAPRTALTSAAVGEVAGFPNVVVQRASAAKRV